MAQPIWAGNLRYTIHKRVRTNTIWILSLHEKKTCLVGAFSSDKVLLGAHGDVQSTAPTNSCMQNGFSANISEFPHSFAHFYVALFVSAWWRASVNSRSIEFVIGWRLEGFNFQFFSESLSVSRYFFPIILEDMWCSPWKGTISRQN